MKRFIASGALALFSFAGVGIVLPVAASAAPCAFPAGATFCTPRNEDNRMAPYEGRKGPREAKRSPRSVRSSR